jgi:hypothetical protein
MLKTFKIRKCWILTFCMIVCSITSIYSQEIPDSYIGVDVPVLTAMYKARGFSDAVIDLEIKTIREDRKKRFLEDTKYQSTTLKLKQQAVNISVIKKSSILMPNMTGVSETTMGVEYAKVSSRALNLAAANEENLIIKKDVNTKFFIESTSVDMTYKWIFYEVDNVTKKDSAVTSIAYQKYSVPGIYRITVEVTEANGCISLFTKNVEVKDFGLCVRKPIDFAFETTSTNLKYTWTATNAAGVLVNEVINTNGLYTYTPTLAGDYVIKLVANGVGKCETVFQETVTVVSCEPGGECKNHIAIVVDESGSVDETEVKKIRAQLRSFISEQAKVNDEGKGQMFISLIGMADSDNGVRADNIIEQKVTIGDLSSIGNVGRWIENYGRRFGSLDGISEGSDYWKSGLDVVVNTSFTVKPKLVLLITDGCQTADPVGLKKTMEKFDNYQGSTDMSLDKPHLYVIGIDNGFYVDNPLANKITARNQDPNYVPSLQKNSLTSKVSSYLGKSLQYLFNYQNNAFPIERVDGFDSATYFGHSDFTMLNDEPYYFSDNIVLADVGCGELSEKEFCANCLSFQPEIGAEYLLSAWVKEETNIQVKSYENSEIDVVFYNNAEAADLNPKDPTAPSQVITTVVLKPSGDIIDGWQRISGRFIVPENTITAGVVLNNKNVGIPVYFDDLRIHPVEGSVKTFVYDSETFKLMSELDENNYSTFYEYDNEGGLVRVKKETAKGIKTIQETRSGSFIKSN